MPRIDCTKPISIKHGNITIKHEFEFCHNVSMVPKNQPAYQTSIGLDIMPELGIILSDAAISHETQNLEDEKMKNGGGPIVGTKLSGHYFCVPETTSSPLAALTWNKEDKLDACGAAKKQFELA
ncbi:hypothetical protein BC940DRAFT_321730 [Gongronella butleri]|nr:hypothetical protein BC940DRAFT_321730 [Gongronella butleri]